MSRTLCFHESAWEDSLYWQMQDKKTLKRINRLIEAVLCDPFVGLGHPEPLKANLSGYWSRAIDQKNRLVYGVTEDAVIIIQCRFQERNFTRAHTLKSAGWWRSESGSARIV